MAYKGGKGAMATSLKGTQSATALKAAAAATLKSAESMNVTVPYKDATVKLGGGGNVTWLGGGTLRKPAIETVWDEEKVVDPSSQTGKLKSLTGKVDRMAGIFEEETRARAEQRQLMDSLHEDQMKRLDEIGEELESSMAETARYLEAFAIKFRAQLGNTFDELHGELQAYVDMVAPRLSALEARGAALKAGIDEEREARIRENTLIVQPLKEQILKLQKNLDHEQAVRQARDAELTGMMDQAISSLESGLEAEMNARQQRQGATIEEWKVEQERLIRRQKSVEETSQNIFDKMTQDMTSETEARIGVQDPVVQALTKFIKEFHADVKEKAEFG